jgi:hypothetical protein|tara:strand:+ start:2420 stop:2632 length:213 start_codon:yes stop_codon:yes gene_type:complete
MADKWIEKAIKKPGALRKEMGVKAGEKIPTEKLQSEETRLRKRGEGEKKLSTADRKKLRRVVLAQTLREL